MNTRPTPNNELNDLRAEIQRKYWKPKTAKKIDGVLAELIGKRGYARELSGASLDEAWQQAAGRLAGHSRPGNLKRGVLEVVVKSSTAMQELGFQKKRILKKLGQLAADQKIIDLKFYVGAID
jgi:predicted nucleic acid-binding Zn ribbon protein